MTRSEVRVPHRPPLRGVFLFPKKLYWHTMRLYFLRHGESEANVQGMMTGQLDVALTDKGRDQAVAAGEFIVSSLITIDKIITSPLVRARETAQLVAATIGYDETTIAETPLLMERYFGTLQGKIEAEIGPITEEMIFQAGAETEAAITERAEAFLALAEMQEGEALLVVSHTGFGRRLRAIIEGISPSEAQGFSNAQLTDLGEI